MLISHSSNARFRIDVFCFCCCFEFFRTILPWLFTLRVCEHTRARCCSAIVRFLTFQHSFFRSSQPYKCAGVHDSQTACVLMHSAIGYVCYKCRNKTLRHYTMQSINQVYGVRNNNEKKIHKYRSSWLIGPKLCEFMIFKMNTKRCERARAHAQTITLAQPLVIDKNKSDASQQQQQTNETKTKQSRDTKQ